MSKTGSTYKIVSKPSQSVTKQAKSKKIFQTGRFLVVFRDFYVIQALPKRDKISPTVTKRYKLGKFQKKFSNAGIKTCFFGAGVLQSLVVIWDLYLM